MLFLLSMVVVAMVKKRNQLEPNRINNHHDDDDDSDIIHYFYVNEWIEWQNKKNNNRLFHHNSYTFFWIVWKFSLKHNIFFIIIIEGFPHIQMVRKCSISVFSFQFYEIDKLKKTGEKLGEKSKKKKHWSTFRTIQLCFFF